MGGRGERLILVAATAATALAAPAVANASLAPRTARVQAHG
jgi:hypothetical protein